MYTVRFIDSIYCSIFSVFHNIFQYLTIFSISVSICLVHSLQVMMSTILIYFIIFMFQYYFSGKVFVCNVKCERVREKIQPFTGLISSTVSGLKLFSITCHKLKHFFLSN